MLNSQGETPGLKENEMSNNSITFNTGREYSAEGQIIVATEFGCYDDIDWFGDSDINQYIIFNDITRGIAGKIELCELTETAIMEAYDKGQYEDC